MEGFFALILISILWGIIQLIYEWLMDNYFNSKNNLDASKSKSTYINHTDFTTKSNYSSLSNYDDKDDENEYLDVHTSETGLAKTLLKNTGSKRMAKDILVEQYGYSQSEAKSLAGYKGY